MRCHLYTIGKLNEIILFNVRDNIQLRHKIIRFVWGSGRKGDLKLSAGLSNIKTGT
jgi:hypothetical protein